jgi:2-haloacid dehalogenase
VELRDFQALSFDCYGTLIDWESGILASLEPWAKQHGLGLDGEALLLAYADQEAAVEAEQPTWRYPQVLAEAFRRTALTLGAQVDDEQLAAFAMSVPAWPAFPDSAGALADLSQQYQLIILSNVDRSSFAGSNARLGVAFDAILTAEDIGSYKPNPRNFAALINHVQQNVPQAPGRQPLLHVAQSLFHDHLPAKAAGLPTVWINRRHDRPGWGATPDPGASVRPDWEFSSMAEFAAAACE